MFRHRPRYEASATEVQDAEQSVLLLPKQSPLFKRSTQVSIITLLPAMVAVLGALAFFLWLNTPLRNSLIQLQYVKCSKPPWYAFDWVTRSSELYTLDSISLPATSWDADKPKVGHLQICTLPRKHWALETLLKNHRAYAESFGIEYLVRGGGNLGTKEKPGQILQIIEKELKKDTAYRMDWILQVPTLM